MSLFPKFQITDRQLVDPAILANIANLEKNVSEISDFSNPGESPDHQHKPDRGQSINEAVELFKRRGWVQIWSTYLSESIYLVRHKSVKVPDNSLLKYTQAEIEALKDLTLEELQTMHEAKKLFGGTVHEK